MFYMILTATYSEIAENKKVDKPFFRTCTNRKNPSYTVYIHVLVHECVQFSQALGHELA